MSRLLIQFSRLFKFFYSRPLFEDLSFSINEGEIFALIGENGAGKTTLLQILAGNIQADAGDFSKAPHLSMGLLPQEIFLSDPSISVRKFIEKEALLLLEAEMATCLEKPELLHKWVSFMRGMSN